MQHHPTSLDIHRQSPTTPDIHRTYATIRDITRHHRLNTGHCKFIPRHTRSMRFNTLQETSMPGHQRNKQKVLAPSVPARQLRSRTLKLIHAQHTSIRLSHAHTRPADSNTQSRAPMRKNLHPATGEHQVSSPAITAQYLPSRLHTRSTPCHHRSIPINTRSSPVIRTHTPSVPGHWIWCRFTPSNAAAAYRRARTHTRVSSRPDRLHVPQSSTAGHIEAPSSSSGYYPGPYRAPAEETRWTTPAV